MTGSKKIPQHQIKLTLIRGAITIVLVLVIFYGIRFLIVEPLTKSAETIDHLSTSFREVGLSLVEKGFSNDSESLIFEVRKDRPMVNLVTAERTFCYEYRYTTTWWWSKKELVLRAQFRAYGGIDLDRTPPVRLIFPANGKGDIKAEGVYGSIVSCELVPGTLQIVNDQNGIWNRLSHKDTKYAVNEMTQAARKLAEASGLAEQAEVNFHLRLQNKARGGKDGWIGQCP